MNTIPSTFNERNIPYTILFGGEEQEELLTLPISAVVLNRGGRHYRATAFEELTRWGIPSIISCENSVRSHDIEALSAEFPRVRFILPSEPISIGEMINIAIAESKTPLVLVVWSDVRIEALAPAITDPSSEQARICTTPILLSKQGEQLPTQIVPSLQGSNFSTEQLFCLRDKTPTVYPFDFMGIYHKEKFIELGGFDYTIKNTYWQNLDFGMRSFLWGESISHSISLRMHYEAKPNLEDISADASYRRFYLKNLAPSLGRKGAVIRLGLFWSFLHNSGLNPINAWTHFQLGRQWVQRHASRFKSSANDLTKRWEPMK